jgi:alpha-ketoglutarate-dependent taurine dioxygenase
MAPTAVLKTVKLTPTVGAAVLDVDVERLLADEALPSALMTALEQSSVLVFHGLNIDDATQVEFSRRLGELVMFPGEPNPEILVVSLDPEHPYAAYLVECLTFK